ncbi:MAG: serine hydrolase [Rikenellaceae bacterium]
MYKKITTTLLLIISQLSIFAQNTITTDSLDSYINNAIKEYYFPGAQIIIGNKSDILYSKHYGYLDYSKQEAVDDKTLFDIASCTKVCATTLAVMTLIDQGRLSLRDQVGDLLNLSDTLQFRDVRVEEFLYHTSGFPSGVSVALSLVKPLDEKEELALSKKKSKAFPYLYDKNYYAAKDIVYDSLYISGQAGSDKIQITKQLYLDKSYHTKLDSMIHASFRPERRGQHIYSDLSFYFLQQIVEQVTSMPLDKYVAQIYAKMELNNIGYNPLEWSERSRIAPTENETLFRRDSIRGIVHDDMACVLGGVCGNAGLFATASDVAQIAAMFLCEGSDRQGRTIVSPETVEKFTQHVRSGGSIYALGFTKVDSKKLPYTPESYGHTGYTGTFMWIDPEREIYVVLLTNRVHPARANKKFDSQYRGNIWQIANSIF